MSQIFAWLSTVFLLVPAVVLSAHGHSLIGAAFVISIFNLVNLIDLLAGFLTGGLLLLFIFVATFFRPQRLTNRATG